MNNTGVKNVIIVKNDEEENKVVDKIREDYKLTTKDILNTLYENNLHNYLTNKIWECRGDEEKIKEFEYRLYVLNNYGYACYINRFGIPEYAYAYEVDYMQIINYEEKTFTLENCVLATKGDYAIIDFEHVDAYKEHIWHSIYYDEIDCDINELQYIYENYHMDENDNYINCADTLIIRTSEEELEDMKKEKREYEEWIQEQKKSEIA